MQNLSTAIHKTDVNCQVMQKIAYTQNLLKINVP